MPVGTISRLLASPPDPEAIRMAGEAPGRSTPVGACTLSTSRNRAGRHRMGSVRADWTSAWVKRGRPLHRALPRRAKRLQAVELNQPFAVDTAAVDVAEAGVLLARRAAHVQIEAAVGLDDEHPREALSPASRTPEPRLVPFLGARVVQRQPKRLGLAA